MNSGRQEEDDEVSVPARDAWPWAVFTVSQLADAYHEAIPRIMQRTASAQDVALASDSVV